MTIVWTTQPKQQNNVNGSDFIDRHDLNHFIVNLASCNNAAKTTSPTDLLEELDVSRLDQLFRKP